MGSTETVALPSNPKLGRLETFWSSQEARLTGKLIAMTCLSYSKSGSDPKNNMESKGILDQHC